MSLNAVNIGHNRYCGPAVLSILTGKSTDECARVISSINGKYTIEGVELRHLLEAADRLGFDCEPINPSTTLFGSLVSIANRDGLYIVTVTGHFVAIEVSQRKIYFCDNHTKEPMPAASSARLQQKCKAIHRVEKRREPVQVSDVIYPEIRRKESDGRVIVTVKQSITYDIKKYDKEIIVARFGFNNSDDFDTFLAAMHGWKETEV